MIIDILNQPDSSVARVTFKAGEELTAQAGAMIAMSNDIAVNTVLRRGKGGGIVKNLKRMLAEESLFLSTFSASSDGCKMYLASSLIGDIFLYEMNTYKLIVQATSYLASTPEIDIFLGFQGVKSRLAKESFFWLSITGKGQVLLSSFGRIYEVSVDGEYIVDTGHIVAFENTLKFEIIKTNSSLLGAFLGKKSLVCRLKGQGKLYCQTHHPQAFATLIGSQLPPQ